jgi:ribosomal protein S18 acetylase RimI-like enzyme
LDYTLSMTEIKIRPLVPEDQGWIISLLTDEWGSPMTVRRGQVDDASQLPGFTAVQQGENVGLVTFQIWGSACEIVTLNSWRQNLGVGTALIEAVKREALKAGCIRLWLITTNDNLPALGFYQKRGFHLVAVHPKALEKSRQIKPSIPEFGLGGIPLRDELELEILLTEK